MGLTLSFVAFVCSLFFGRRSLGAGMAVVLTVGYFYAIVRARYLDGFSHFTFDAAVLGFYLAHFTKRNALWPPNAKGLATWTLLLFAWPFIVLAMGMVFPQHVLIQMVGLRAAIWFLPFLLLGVSTRPGDLTLLARVLAILNLAALGFAVGEYVLGLEAFFPKNAVTELMYRSSDVGEHGFHRIPATFAQAASYGAIMVATVPCLIGRWAMPSIPLLERVVLTAGLVAAALGTFLSGARTPVVLLVVLAGFIAYFFRIRLRYLIPAIIMTCVVGYFVAGNERLQRVATLAADPEDVLDRVGGSVNVGVLDLFLDYPMGAGLGSAFGTSIPSFLADVAPTPIGAENEYARIGVEQGVCGLILWLLFLGWFVTRRRVPVSPEWTLGCKLMFAYVVLVWATSCIGTGLLTAIPMTTLLLFQMGTLARDRPSGVVPENRMGQATGRGVALTRGTRLSPLAERLSPKATAG
jgi:hypothetical protein